ncbi:GNAT family protein [Streptomyces sp. NPDC048550]|uniref:GNAT family N-acetyltransferase n=1 Tax=unclassified Streptomyces TaxID=2593676 RepID=UPI002251AB46|nr:MULTISPECIES: GNAT family protein [unclassified Streptomyces]MCX5145229.1 GNAT family N-acetyltransferase [Streptomyces sp. NBC_00320]WSN48550.1 GNAT family protein [Streptomyces sp. NBC_01296]WSW62037.1 GNAT family N-acetyltransferase [Streptomyces sp. NBC_00998]
MFSIDLADDAQLFPLEVWHAEEFLAHMDRGREFIGEHIVLADFVTDLDSARGFLSSYAQKTAADGGRIYGIRVGGTLVGGVLFRTFDAESGNCEVGCWLEPAAAGRGLVSTACRVLIDWAFHERGMHRAEWHASSANKKSLAVAERLGMTREGVLREAYPYRGVRQNTEIWAVLAHEWPPAPTA